MCAAESEPRSYLYPWISLSDFCVVFVDRNTSARKKFLGSLSRVFIKDSDLLFLCKKGKEVEELTEEMTNVAVESTSEVGTEATASNSSEIAGDPYKDIPKCFGSQKKDVGHSKNKKRFKNVEFDTFEDYWPIAEHYVVYSTWLKDYGDIMDPENREALRQQVEEAKPATLIDSHLQIEENVDYDNLARRSADCPTDSYEAVFALHCRLIREQSRRDFEIFRAARITRKAKQFLFKVERLGFVPGYTEKSFPAELSDTASSSSLPKKTSTKSTSDEPFSSNDVFDDLTYTINDAFGTNRNLVWNADKEDEKEFSIESVQIESKEANFAFDPEKERHLIASLAGEYYKKDNEIRKYFNQRYRLFSKLDQGIIMDREGWFSVTPERIAEHIADRVVFPNCSVVVDAFAGVGGNSIQFALRGVHVIAVDMDPCRLKCARHNARVYGVEDRISFICADFFHFAASWTSGPFQPKIDAVFLSPPWGGPSYLKAKEFDLNTGVTPNGVAIFDAAVRLSPNIAYFLPRNTKLDQLIGLSSKTGNRCEIEQSSLNSKIKTITAYYGELAVCQQ